MLEDARHQHALVAGDDVLGAVAVVDIEVDDRDPLEADYTWITVKIKALADKHAGGRIVSCLEGGYNLGALARSVAAHLRVLMQ